jgi:sec-independent protein translocase protein TatA
MQDMRRPTTKLGGSLPSGRLRFIPPLEHAGRLMFGIGTTELIIVAIIILILFGSRLPSVMRSLGQGVVEFKKGVQGIEEDDKSQKPTQV